MAVGGGTDSGVQDKLQSQYLPTQAKRNQNKLKLQRALAQAVGRVAQMPKLLSFCLSAVVGSGQG